MAIGDAVSVKFTSVNSVYRPAAGTAVLLTEFLSGHASQSYQVGDGTKWINIPFTGGNQKDVNILVNNTIRLRNVNHSVSATIPGYALGFISEE